MNILKGRGRYSRSTYIRINRPLPLVQTTQQNHASRTTRLANACAFKTHAIEFKAMTTPHLSLSPFFARTVTALALFRTIAPHFALLRDAFETLEDVGDVFKRLQAACERVLKSTVHGKDSPAIPIQRKARRGNFTGGSTHFAIPHRHQKKQQQRRFIRLRTDRRVIAKFEIKGIKIRAND